MNHSNPPLYPSLRIIVSVALLFYIAVATADEGMFQINRTDRMPWERMTAMGLSLSPRQLYNPDSVSLADAVVMFANGCTGAVVSPEGLVLTNHHCGYEYIQQQSTTARNYLRDGFTARTRSEEIPIPGLTVTFLRRIENVTDRIVPQVDSCMSNLDRQIKADSIGKQIGAEAVAGTAFRAEVLPFYEGLEYYLLVYDVYRDVRLVLAPPSYVGKFGGESDNWIWPRYTGDFSLFRIYGSPHGGAADYALENIPLSTPQAATLSLSGCQEGDFAMTLGYPGATDRNLTSFGVDQLNHGENQPRVEIRTAKQALWRKAMEQSAELKLKYANAYSGSSNYWKYSIGQQQAIERDSIVHRKRNQETRFALWASTYKRSEYTSVLSDLEQIYLRRERDYHALTCLTEALLSSSDLLTLALALQAVDDKSSEACRTLVDDIIRPHYAHVDINTDKEMLKQMVSLYRRLVDKRYLPDFYDIIDKQFKGNSDRYIDRLYARSIFARPQKLEKRIGRGIDKLHSDPLWELAFSVQMMQYDILSSMAEADDRLAHAKRIYLKGQREMAADSIFYPDANFTMRLSYGRVLPVQFSSESVTGSWFTTVQQMVERTIPNHDEYHTGQPLLELIRQKEFGPYADRDGSLHVALLTDNDITGGNSGSPLFNSCGQIIGLAFDGNWDGMSSDISYNAAKQRTISVDIRYLLFIIDRLCNGKHLVDEFRISKF